VVTSVSFHAGFAERNCDAARLARGGCTSDAQMFRAKAWFLRGLRASILPGHPRGIDFSNELRCHLSFVLTRDKDK
jgi:hypothetical protein